MKVLTDLTLEGSPHIVRYQYWTYDDVCYTRQQLTRCLYHLFKIEKKCLWNHFYIEKYAVAKMVCVMISTNAHTIYTHQSPKNSQFPSVCTQTSSQQK